MIVPMETVEEPARVVPVKASVDVLVVGGGPAGIAAAIAAGRKGAHTLLIERYGYLGGMITGSNVIAVIGGGDGIKGLVRGITQDIRERLEQLDAATPLRFSDYRVDPEVFKWQAFEMIEEAGGQVLLHTLGCAPLMEDGVVRGVFVENKSGRQAIRAKVTIDASADADIAFHAGCACDNQTHDVTLAIKLEEVDREKVDTFRKESPDEYEKIKEEIEQRYDNAILSKQFMKDLDVADVDDLTKAEISARRNYFGALKYLKKHMPGYEQARISITRPQLGVRQGRRIRGEYIFTIDDLRSNRHFEDAVARLGVYAIGYRSNYSIEGLNYDVPYRSLVPEKIDGLLVAGRCVSSDYEALHTLRLIVPCFATGQAAGIAAALAAQEGCVPRKVSIKKLREALKKQHVYLG